MVIENQIIEIPKKIFVTKFSATVLLFSVYTEDVISALSTRQISNAVIHCDLQITILLCECDKDTQLRENIAVRILLSKSAIKHR